MKLFSLALVYILFSSSVFAQQAQPEALPFPQNGIVLMVPFPNQAPVRVTVIPDPNNKILPISQAKNMPQFPQAKVTFANVPAVPNPKNPAYPATMQITPHGSSVSYAFRDPNVSENLSVSVVWFNEDPKAAQIKADMVKNMQDGAQKAKQEFTVVNCSDPAKYNAFVIVPGFLFCLTAEKL